MPLKLSVNRINKKQKYFSPPDHEVSKHLILNFGIYERPKKELKLHVFSYNCVTQIASMIFSIQCSFTDHLLKTQNR